MIVLASILSLLIAVAGWHYLFYSTAAMRLSGIEDERINRRRNGMRRLGGVVMLLLAGFFFAGFWTFDFDDLQGQGRRFILVWGTVALLIVAMMVLAIVDLRLTTKLRKKRRMQDLSSNGIRK